MSLQSVFNIYRSTVTVEAATQRYLDTDGLSVRCLKALQETIVDSEMDGATVCRGSVGMIF